MDFTPITTQEQFESAIKERISREHNSAAKSTREAMVSEGWTSPDDLKKVKDDYEKQISDLTKAAEDNAKKYADFDKKIAERDAKIKGYESASVKTRIAHETGLPYELASRLSGDDEDSIRKDAENLVKLIGKQPHVTTPLAEGSDDTGKESKNSALRALAKGLRGE